ncbi:MAG: thiol:disulfide interchange protein DsbA/DsbL [Burkholderiaceae bacterium]|nr:thiol:disulfide interchange protein DsbA/DsbL [Rhodoferax sp.]MCP5285124.1 thiol:disulfide interchange protein DsbA/DsbL [Burkholderiaceae bacterium]
MKRREFSQALAAGGMTLWAGGAAHAQGAPVEGRDYVKLSQPAPVSLSTGKKVEVIEFFWYECTHCNDFEPLLEAWVKRLPADVEFRRVPVGFTARHQIAQKAFYAMEEIGMLETLHARVFAAVFLQGRKLLSEQAYADFVAANGGDAKKFSDAFRGFSVNTKANRARQLADAYKIDGTPAMGVQGRFYTGAGRAGGHAATLRVTDYLIQQVR